MPARRYPCRRYRCLRLGVRICVGFCSRLRFRLCLCLRLRGSSSFCVSLRLRRYRCLQSRCRIRPVCIRRRCQRGSMLRIPCRHLSMQPSPVSHL